MPLCLFKDTTTHTTRTAPQTTSLPLVLVLILELEHAGAMLAVLMSARATAKRIAVDQLSSLRDYPNNIIVG